MNGREGVAKGRSVAGREEEWKGGRVILTETD